MRIFERFNTFIDSFSTEELLSLSSDLTEGERNSPAAKYYDLGPAQVPEEELATFEPGHPMDISKAFMPEDIALHMAGANVDAKLSGYCILPNGVGFGAAWTDMSEITPEIDAFYDNNWNPEGDMFYKCWFPGTHIKHCIDGAIEKLLGDPMIFRLEMAPPLNVLGFPENLREADPDFLAMVGGNGRVMKITDRDGVDRMDATMLHFIRRSGAGTIFCSRIWVGLTINRETGKSDVTLPYYATTREDIIRDLCVHAATEYATLARNMKLFWDSNH